MKEPKQYIDEFCWKCHMSRGHVGISMIMPFDHVQPANAIEYRLASKYSEFEGKTAQVSTK